MRALLTSVSLVVMALSTPAQSAPAPSANGKSNPNERVCERIPTIGSRVAAKRVCATRAEWDEKRKLDREAVDQAQRSANGPCNSTLTHTGAPAC